MVDPVFLGIEGGGTRTTAVFVSGDLTVRERAEFGPGNFRLLSSDGLDELFRRIAAAGPAPAAIGIGLAGVRDENDRNHVCSAAQRIWGQVPVVATHDLEIALDAGTTIGQAGTQVLVLSGTGSCCYGRNEGGVSAKVGGWGHLLGDLGSGYDIAARALKSVVYEFDRHGTWTLLGRRILSTLLLNSPDDLIGCVQASGKADLARLAPVVFDSGSAGDPLARKILGEVAERLAADALTCAARLTGKGQPVLFLLAGSVLQRQAAFAQKVGRLIRKECPGARIQVQLREGAIGAAKLARESVAPNPEKKAKSLTQERRRYVPAFHPERSPTEMRNPKSAHLDRLSIQEAVALMLDADKAVVPALVSERKQIERAVRTASNAITRGGRIFYIGAGTSGRLGVLDASECPPTFRVPSEMVQGIIAGGQTALWQAVEGAEDNWEAGAAAVVHRGVTARDVAIGIAASGRTPFVWGALTAAKELGSKTILLCFNPGLEIEKEHRPDLVIAPNVGAEILTGSTRLKCGTATKSILNIISTLSMVRLGKVVGNLMIDLNPSNVKLRDRAVRIVGELTQATAKEAADCLERNGWAVPAAVKELTRGATRRGRSPGRSGRARLSQ